MSRSPLVQHIKEQPVLEHLLNALLALSAIGAQIACIFAPIFSAYALFLIAPVSAYLMHRYHPLAPMLVYLSIFIPAFIVYHSYVLLFFLPITLLSQLGLYFALNHVSYFKAAAVAIALICVGSVSSVCISMAVGRSNDLPYLVRQEILKGDTEFVRANARALFNQLYPTEEDKALFRMPADVELPENADQAFYELYVYAVSVESELRVALIAYLFRFVVLLSVGGYMLAGLFLRLLGSDSKKIIRLPEPLPLGKTELPTRYLLFSLPPVLLFYLLSLITSFFDPVQLAVYYALLLAPCSLAGVCFLAFVAQALPKMSLRIVASGAIIGLVVMCIFTDVVLFILAVIGLVEYILKIRQMLSHHLKERL